MCTGEYLYFLNREGGRFLNMPLMNGAPAVRKTSASPHHFAVSVALHQKSGKFSSRLMAELCQNGTSSF